MVPRVNAPLMEIDALFCFGGKMTKTIEEQLKSLREETLASLKQLKAENQKELQDLRVAVLGKKGSLTEVL